MQKHPHAQTPTLVGLQPLTWFAHWTGFYSKKTRKKRSVHAYWLVCYASQCKAKTANGKQDLRTCTITSTPHCCNDMWHRNVCGVCFLPGWILPIGNIHTIMVPWDKEDLLCVCVCVLESGACVNSYEERVIDSECLSHWAICITLAQTNPWCSCGSELHFFRCCCDWAFLLSRRPCSPPAVRPWATGTSDWPHNESLSSWHSHRHGLLLTLTQMRMCGVMYSVWKIVHSRT